MDSFPRLKGSAGRFPLVVVPTADREDTVTVNDRCGDAYPVLALRIQDDLQEVERGCLDEYTSVILATHGATNRSQQRSTCISSDR